MITIFNFDELI